LDGSPQEEAPEQTVIQATQDGPLYVRGDLRIVGQDGATRQLRRAALCRCGQSRNKPFCDGSHWDIDFKT
jgi:CDGSH-type Zn-finger protein